MAFRRAAVTERGHQDHASWEAQSGRERDARRAGGAWRLRRPCGHDCARRPTRGGRDETVAGQAVKKLDDFSFAANELPSNFSGKVRSIGSSAFPAELIVEAQWDAARLGHHRFQTEQPRYSILTRIIEAAVLPTAQRYGHGCHDLRAAEQRLVVRSGGPNERPPPGRDWDEEFRSHGTGQPGQARGGPAAHATCRRRRNAADPPGAGVRPVRSRRSSSAPGSPNTLRIPWPVWRWNSARTCSTGSMKSSPRAPSSTRRTTTSPSHRLSQASGGVVAEGARLTPTWSPKGGQIRGRVLRSADSDGQGDAGEAFGLGPKPCGGGRRGPCEVSGPWSWGRPGRSVRPGRSSHR